ncbi:phosphoribosylglycinamide formyltransferase [Serpentinicella alkaliphila]|uniref:Phosphoribosylglycinamide formyltransferase n=1 Tax=Serpentinicella alkaliphila TaxID=1734049 RepID=A0A4R2TLP5_9FIRM|nr:phosphoribosylglycinamide formyltransferase [Serpentinicella alkaliphila]QUH24844.1 phosphoribosylglycinamide formyltransferase [Serpentinicella alkaliphila]TCQ03447.1 formyltetrahydrofolate-dependent phosphoribosylglycinamide formyltransferase [Serpentinicella alkaliphila]
MSRVKIAVLISGSGSNLQALMDSIKLGEIDGDIKLVISNKKGVYGLERAETNNIKTYVIDRETYAEQKQRDNLLLDLLESNKIDLVVLAGYLAMVPENVINRYRNKIINIHPSLIPSFSGKGFYGGNVHRAAVERGVKITGATVHFVNEETDGGPIILQEIVKVDVKDTAEDVQKKVLEVEHKILPYAVKLFIERRLRVVDNKVEILQ